jgi:carbon monoxide dehydrogenase subunit G
MDPDGVADYRPRVLSAEASIEVDRPTQEVWAFIADLDNLRSWNPELTRVEWQPPVELGLTFTLTLNIGVRLVGDARITDYQVDRSIGWNTQLRAPRWLGGGSSVAVVYFTEPVGEGRTRLGRQLRLGPRGLLWLLAPLLVLVLRRDQFVAQEIVDIKEILEAPDAS